MTEAQFSEWSLRILLPALVLVLLYIVWDLAKQSKAGRFGTWILFSVLGLGMMAFVLKELFMWLMSF